MIYRELFTETIPGDRGNDTFSCSFLHPDLLNVRLAFYNIHITKII